MLNFLGKLCCWLCCTILALPQGWCCMVASSRQETAVTAEKPAESAVKPCCCCGGTKAPCCGPASDSPKSQPERKGPPDRCRMCDRDATKPKLSTNGDLDDAGSVLAFPPF